MVVAGVDYSLTSPAVCVHSGEEWKYENCKFYYMVPNEKKIREAKNYNCTVYPEWSEDCERFNNLAEWSLQWISAAGCSRVAIEGYAFGAVGRVFQIAENAGLLKYKLWKQGIPYSVPAPTEIKKFATLSIEIATFPENVRFMLPGKPGRRSWHAPPGKS